MSSIEPVPLRQLVAYAAMAPSGHNTQPWRFELKGGQIILRADRSRALRVCDPMDRELTICCGAALFHLRIALHHAGYAGVIERFPDPSDPDLLARVHLGHAEPPTQEDAELFAAIPRRHTNRQPFESKPLALGVVDELCRAAGREGAWLRVLDNGGARAALGELIAEGDRRQAADPAFRKELATWIRPNRSRSRDGMPGYAFGMNDLVSILGPFVMRTFDWGNGQAARDKRLVEGSPVLAVLGCGADIPSGWLASGEALAHVLLLLTAHGAVASFLNQPVEVAELRPRLAALLHRPGYPQVVLRMGYGRASRSTPRRKLDELLVQTSSAIN